MPFSFHLSDGPAVVRVNIFVRSISRIDDVTMVSGGYCQWGMVYLSYWVVRVERRLGWVGYGILFSCSSCSSLYQSHLLWGRIGVRVLLMYSGGGEGAEPSACMQKKPMRDVIGVGVVPRSRDSHFLIEYKLSNFVFFMTCRRWWPDACKHQLLSAVYQQNRWL